MAVGSHRFKNHFYSAVTLNKALIFQDLPKESFTANNLNLTSAGDKAIVEPLRLAIAMVGAMEWRIVPCNFSRKLCFT